MPFVDIHFELISVNDWIQYYKYLLQKGNQFRPSALSLRPYAMSVSKTGSSILDGWGSLHPTSQNTKQKHLM